MATASLYPYSTISRCLMGMTICGMRFGYVWQSFSAQSHMKDDPDSKLCSLIELHEMPHAHVCGGRQGRRILRDGYKS